MNNFDLKIDSIKHSQKPMGLAGRFFVTLFLLPFLGFGLFFTGMAFSNMDDWIAMKSWESVPARIFSVNLKTTQGDNSGATYRAEARYEYQYKGRNYTGDRASIYNDENDNIGSFHEDLVDYLKSEQQSGGATTAYVDPDDPSQSVLSRDFRWGFFIFKFLFGAIFALIGGGLMWAVWSKTKPRPLDHPVNSSTPWLANKNWQTPEIRSDAKLAMWGAVGFCVIWNVISFPSAYFAWPEIQSGNYAAWLAFLFPLVGLWLFYRAGRHILEYRRFGQTILTMDPFPGAIGGHVGGTIDVNGSFPQDVSFVIKLENIYTYISGSGKNRSRSERIIWGREVVAEAEPYLSGTRLTFRFDVPDEDSIHQSDSAPEDSDYYLWRVSVMADLPGVDMDRLFEIPVYPTGEKSRRLSDRIVELMAMETAEHHKKELSKTLPVRYGISGSEIFYPSFQNFGWFIGGILFGAIFTGVAVFMYFQDTPVRWLFITVFGLIGGLIMVFSILGFFGSLRVYSDGAYLYAKRTYFGCVPLTDSILISDIQSITHKSGMSSSNERKTTQYFDIYVHGRERKKIRIAKWLKGQDQADLAIEEIYRVFNIAKK